MTPTSGWCSHRAEPWPRTRARCRPRRLACFRLRAADPAPAANARKAVATDSRASRRAEAARRTGSGGWATVVRGPRRRTEQPEKTREGSGGAWSTFLARARAGHIGVVARRDAHVDDAHGAVLDHAQSLRDRRSELGDLRDRADAFRALRARHHRE